jgi:hypothetical protein
MFFKKEIEDISEYNVIERAVCFILRKKGITFYLTLTDLYFKVISDN